MSITGHKTIYANMFLMFKIKINFKKKTNKMDINIYYYIGFLIV